MWHILKHIYVAAIIYKLVDNFVFDTFKIIQCCIDKRGDFMALKNGINLFRSAFY